MIQIAHPPLERTPTRRQINRARELARKIEDAAIVYESDHEDTRRVSVASYEYIDNPEFHAFDGIVLAVVWPDGTVES